jgi:hypothetical protein
MLRRLPFYIDNNESYSNKNLSPAATLSPRQ